MFLVVAYNLNRCISLHYRIPIYCSKCNESDSLLAIRSESDNKENTVELSKYLVLALSHEIFRIGVFSY